MSSMNSREVEDLVGKYVQTNDLLGDGPVSFRPYMRIRVLIPVEEPLKKGFTIEREDGTIREVEFKYERLSNFCYKRGRLGHIMRNCVDLEMIRRFPHLSFGSYLQADGMGRRGFKERGSSGRGSSNCRGNHGDDGF
ncbi:hypothetical protein Tsubulata_000671 [Turnera subulata]|uniref:Zinc knuckle CX2CX4HX4C domain-containing protein n=1 Tax=Turnera subulata TaxID=218843 RepID=A0A9Q0FGN8_9ROSI|nr:hypothetical protein Tsubulata_000671 [Turnera subulata]